MFEKRLRRRSYRLPRLSLLLSLLVILSSLVVGQVAQTTSPLKNFGKVNDNYYRGSQPKAGDFSRLKQVGIKTIIDLRRDYEPDERSWAINAGMQYFNIPLKSSQPATDEQTAYFISLVNNPANWPVYVHCKGGRHRTGALTAIYRITHDRWTAERAFEEMKQYDFDHGLFGGPGAQKKYVFSFYQKLRAGNAGK